VKRVFVIVDFVVEDLVIEDLVIEEKGLGRMIERFKGTSMLEQN
jgi:hypothetical protein